jgi:hypothetical protein
VSIEPIQDGSALDGRLRVTFNKAISLFSVGNQNGAKNINGAFIIIMTERTVAPADNDLRTAKVSIDRVELQLVRVFGGSVPRSIQYMTYGLRDLTTSTLQHYTTTLQVPSDRTPNIIVLWQQTLIRSSHFLSFQSFYNAFFG